MNKADMIEHIAQSAEISKSAAERAVDAMVGAIKSSLKKGDSVTLVGFGTFYAGKRAARTGRNPQTGDSITIDSRRVLSFKPSQVLKDRVNNGTGGKA